MDLAALRAVVTARVRAWAIAQAVRQGKNLSDTRTQDWLESLIRYRVRDLLPSALDKGALPGDTGIAEVGDPVDADIWYGITLEHGVLDYDGFPPVVGYTDATLSALIASSQGEGRDITHYDAAAINARTAAIRTYQNAAPASSWTDLMRLHVQAVYGSSRTDYTTSTSGASCNIIFPGGYSFSCWWGGTTALMRVGRYEYVYIYMDGTTITRVQTTLSAAGEAHRLWLIAAIDGDDPSLDAEQIAIEEVAILSQLSPTGSGSVIYTRPGGPDAWEGSPLSYGWQYLDEYPGGPGDYDLGELEAKVTCLGSGAAGPGIGSYTHTLVIEWDGASWDVDDSTITHDTAASIGTGVAIMRMDVSGDLERWGEAGTTPDGSSAALMGHYTDAGAWVEEVYSSTASGGVEEERLNERTACDGTAAGRSGRWNHTYSAESELSSLSIRVATIDTDSQTGESTPYGNASSTGTQEIEQAQTWSGGSPGADTCGDKPADFQPATCGEDDNPTKQYRWMHQEKETLTVRGGEYSGAYSGWLTIVPCRGQAGVWYVVGGESRTDVAIRDTPLIRTSSNLYEGRSIERGSSPTNYCNGSDWDRASPSIAWGSDGSPTNYPAFTASKMTVVRNGPDGITGVFVDGGVDDTIPALSGALLPIRPGGGDYDPSKSYAGSLWDNFANPAFDVTFNPPVSFSSAEGIICYTEEPGNPPTAPLVWPDPYSGTFEPTGEDWAWIGKV